MTINSQTKESNIKKVTWKQMGVAVDELSNVVTYYSFQPGKFLVISTPDPLRVIVLYVYKEQL